MSLVDASGWEIKKEKHVLEVKDNDRAFKAHIKWDGCVDYRQWSNGDESEQDYIHICNIDEMIERLQKMKEEAIKHFGKDWE